MHEKEISALIDLTPYLRHNRRRETLEMLYTPLALWTQYLSLGVLVLYGLLRLAVCPGTPLGTYSGSLFLLWPLAYALLLTSWLADMFLGAGSRAVP